MNISKRDFLKATGASLLALSTASQASSDTSSALNVTNKSKNDLPNITSDVMPISSAERKVRIAKAQQLMQQFNTSALST